MPTASKEKPALAKLFETFGCEINLNGSKQAQADCPFCGRPRFYLNIETGQYQCKHANTCGRSGNAYDFIRWVHQTCLKATTDDDYRTLKEKRGLPLQTLKRHQLAWNEANGCWLIAYMSEEGKVLNLTRYFVGSGDKLSLPGLPLQPYGLNEFKRDPQRDALWVEGPWDAISCDHHFREKKTRDRYDVLAVPSATVFKPEWLKHLEGRRTRLCLDNDKAGRDGQQRIIKLVRDQKLDCQLSALVWPAGTPDKFDIGDLIKNGENVAEFTRAHCVKVEATITRIIFTRGDEVPEERIEWLWNGRIQMGTFVSFAGLQGTQKSTIAKDIAARCTAGKPMPNAEEGLPPFDVFYLTSEDSKAQVCDLVKIHGGDLTRLHVHDISDSTEPIDFLDCIEQVESDIRSCGARLVILDALNSFVGGDISTDSKARRTLSGRLQALARRTGACIIGIRNWGRMDGGTSSQKSLGATSLSDVARCVMNTVELPTVKEGAPRRFLLEFEKVSNAPKPLAIPFGVKNLSTCEADKHRRRILWEKPVTQAELKQELLGKKVAKKGSASARTHKALIPFPTGGKR